MLCETTSALKKGWDYFCPLAGKVKSQKCHVCGEFCEVERDVFMSSCCAAAMAKMKSWRDVFTCSHVHDTWHLQARQLRQQLVSAVGRRQRAMLQADLDELLRERC
ncbi:MAG: hypothetical protein KAI66_21920 [Lentisphaeria bacterium]|nr:hypothetical protein [Lentisphaeria bacterium]